MIRAALIGLMLAPVAAHAEVRLSRATEYLIGREAEKGCPQGGRFDGGFFELDLTGDDIRDLVLSHEGLTCDEAPVRSLLCGTEDCTILLFVGLENGLLVQVDTAFGHGVVVSGGAKPIISLTDRSGTTQHLHWADTQFEETSQ